MIAAILFATITIQSAIHSVFPVGTIGTPVTHGDLAIVSVDVEEEGERNKSDMLLQRFPFGWQTIELGRTKVLPCALRVRGADDAAVRFFAASIGLGKDTHDGCDALSRDRGPEADVVAVRGLMGRHQMTPSVHVVEGYAVGAWYGWGGGETIFARRNGVWERIGGGGGAFGPGDLTSTYGVPSAIAEKLLEMNGP